jgi:hypothetical protein
MSSRSVSSSKIVFGVESNIFSLVIKIAVNLSLIFSSKVSTSRKYPPSDVVILGNPLEENNSI